MTDDGKNYTDYCMDSSLVKEYYCSISDAHPTGIVGEEIYACASGCENGACKIQEKPPAVPETTGLKAVGNFLAGLSKIFSW